MAAIIPIHIDSTIVHNLYRVHANCSANTGSWVMDKNRCTVTMGTCVLSMQALMDDDDDHDDHEDETSPLRWGGAGRTNNYFWCA